MTGIVLCGGRSTRMGADKASLPFGNATMLDRIVRILRPITDDVIIVGRRSQSCANVHDAIEDEGPLGGIIAGLKASKTDLNIVIACDMPLINPGVLQRLASLIGDAAACVAVNDGHASALCGVYRSHVASTAQTLFDSGERRVMRLLDQVHAKRVDAAIFRDIDPQLATFTSCDTPEAFHAALVLAGLPDR